MTNNAAAAVTWLLLAGVAGLFVWWRRTTERASFKLEAVQQFEIWQSTPAAEKLQLGPGKCEVLLESETVGRHRGGPISQYTLTRFVQSQSGLYFMFKSNPAGPYVKPVAPHIAKVVLKNKFRIATVNND